MGYIYHVISQIEPYIAAYGVAVLFIVVYLESFGAPLPGETGVVAAGLLAAHGDLPIVPLFIAVFAGAVLGDSTGYAIGRFGGRPLLHRFGPLVKLTPELLASLETRFRKKGVPLVMIARFLPLLRQLNGLIAGAMAMPWLWFLAANAIGAMAWTAAWALGPYFFADLFRSLR